MIDFCLLILSSTCLAWCLLILRDDIRQLRASMKRKQERDRREKLGLCFDCGKPLNNSMYVCDKSNPC
jgi:hypothetical protein